MVFILLLWFITTYMISILCSIDLISQNKLTSFILIIQFHYRRFPKFSSVQFSLSVVSDSLRPHESQHARPPCPLPTPGVYSNSCPSSRWCHSAISSSAVPFSSCPQSLPASGSFPTSQLFAWGGQSTGVSASASVLPMNTQDWSPLGWDLLAVQGTLKRFPKVGAKWTNHCKKHIFHILREMLICLTMIIYFFISLIFLLVLLYVLLFLYC